MTDTLDAPDSIDDDEGEQLTIDGTAAGDPPPADPEAPFGRKPDGTPYKRKPRAYDVLRTAQAKARGAAGGNRSKRSTRKATNAAKKAAASKTKTRKPVNYRQAAADAIAGFVLTPLSMIGTLRNDDRFLADAQIVAHHHGALSDAMADLANHSPAVAGVLARVSDASPFAAITTIGVQIAAQMAVNHGLMPPGFLGTAPPTVLADIARADLQAQVEQMFGEAATAAAGGPVVDAASWPQDAAAPAA